MTSQTTLYEQIGFSLIALDSLYYSPLTDLVPIEDTPAPISYRMEAMDVVLHVGPSIGQPPWCCSLPRIDLRNVLNDFEEIRKYTLSGLTVTRGLL